MDPVAKTALEEGIKRAARSERVEIDEDGEHVLVQVADENGQSDHWERYRLSAEAKQFLGGEFTGGPLPPGGVPARLLAPPQEAE